MINRIISFSIHNKFIIGLLTAVIIGMGIYSMYTINLGSVPDITNNQVQVMTVSPNLSTEDIEQFITYPVEMAMGNLPGVEEIRSVSRFGLSVVTIVFEDKAGVYRPRQLVQEKLAVVKKEIPEKFGSPTMGPITTGLGEIYQYSIDVKEGYDSLYTLSDLRSIQDWIVSRQLTLIEGVVDINSFGGAIKQYEIAINPDKLNAAGVSIADVFSALEKNNSNTGGAYIVRNKMANFIRGEGLIRNLDDIRQVVVKTVNGIPLTVGDLATKVHFGKQISYGAFTKNNKEAVGGMVLMLKGANPSKVVERVKERMAIVQKTLPEGLEIVPFLDQGELISRTTSTIKQNLLEGALIVIFALVILLGSLRGGLITATTIPLSLLFAFILMKEFGVWANLMSLGAIDFGIIVDGAVIIIEGTVFEIQKRIKSGKHTFSQKDMNQLSYDSGSTMMNSAFFGQVIILIVFTPILFLSGIEGKMFHPMAYTFGFAMIGAIVLCLTYVPMMTALLMKPIENKKNYFGKLERGMAKVSQVIIGKLQSIYLPFLKAALRFKMTVLLLALFIIGATVYTFSKMGGEFIPQLDEGDLAVQAMIRPSSSLEESVEASKRIEKLLLDNFPEVKTVVSRIGVADIPTDPMPMDIGDMIIVLEKDHSKWTSAKNKDGLITKMEKLLSENLSGVSTIFTQPVELRFNELLTGVREDVAIKIYGENLKILAEKAAEITQLISDIPGVSDVNAERTSGLPQITVKYNRSKIAQYGFNIEKLNTYVSTAFAGGSAGVIFEGEKRFDMVVRFDKAHRKSIGDLKNLYIDLPSGNQIPIKEVAEISYVPGPMQITRESTFRNTYVGLNVRGRDVESTVNEIQTRLDQELKLPVGYRLSYGGEFENLQQAKSRLAIVVPIVLLLIFILLYFALKSFTQSIMIYIAIPLAAIGGVYALWLRDMPFSISAGVGFIVLFGVAVLNGLVLVSRFNSLKEEGVKSIRERIFTGTKERIRPIMLTATTDVFGFLPMAFSSTAGAEVQRPLATVVIGGMLTATLLTLVILPVLYSLIESRKERKSISHKSSLNMNLILLLFIGVGSLMFPFKSHAQNGKLKDLPSINIEEAQKLALEHYPIMKSARLKIKKTEVMKKTAWDFGNTQLYTGKEEVGNGAEGIYTPIGIRQQNIDIFGIPAKAKLQKEKISLAETELELDEVALRRSVKTAWASCLAKAKLYKTMHQFDSLFSDLKKAAKISYESGAHSKIAYLAMLNQANEVHIEKEQAYRDYWTALYQLNLWLGNDNFYRATEIVSVNLEEISLPAEGLNNHPLLQQFENKTTIADAGLKSQRAAYFPKLQAEYAWQEVGGQSGFHAYQLGIQIPLVFNAQMGKKQAAKIERDIAETQLETAKLNFNSQYKSTIENYKKWKVSWNYYQTTALPLAKEQEDAANTAFSKGALDYIAFLQNMRDAIRIKTKAYEALRQYLISKYELEYYIQSQ